MKKQARVAFVAALAAFAAVAPSPVQADHIPEPPDGVVEYEGRVAALLSVGDFDPVVELRARIEDDPSELRYRALTLGSYYRAHANVKVGAFVRVQQGARHDDDWIEPSAGVWKWKDTTDRTEVVAIADITPRFKLGFLPGENWVLAIKGRYELNTFDMEQSIKARPGLTYFWIVDRNPLLNASLAYEVDFPLNFGSTLVNDQWLYLDVLYHLTPTVKLEASLARRTWTWTDSADFKEAHPTESYEVDYQPWVIGIGVLYLLPL
jgi:hypothetical protein